MYIVFGITPATKLTQAMPEMLTTFERGYDADRFTKMFNPLSIEQKKALVGKEIFISEVLEKDEMVQKAVKIKNEYTITYIEQA